MRKIANLSRISHILFYSSSIVINISIIIFRFSCDLYKPKYQQTIFTILLTYIVRNIARRGIIITPSVCHKKGRVQMEQGTRFIRFIGGKNIIFLLLTLILIGLTVIIYNKISFVFHPLIVILSTVTPPVILAFIAYYLLNLVVNILDKNIIFLLLTLILIRLTLIIYNKISFVFRPVIVILSTATPAVILAFIAYYLLNPVVNILEEIHIKRLWGIIIIIVIFSGLITGALMLTIPTVEQQIIDLIDNFPAYIEKINDSVQTFVHHSVFE